MPSAFAVRAAILYAILVAYSSTIVGVAGPHFVPIDPSEALYRLIHIRYVEHGSDQRSDWMGNLVMLVPLGFLVGGAFSRRDRWSKLAIIEGFSVCFGFILATKYLQLFFPPRTVTLNYVIAQTLGATIGLSLFSLMRSPMAEIRRGFGRLESLRIILRIYTALLILFLLMPLDFALSADDIAAQIDKLPETLFHLSGDGRRPSIQFAVILASIVETVPIGAMLTLVGRGPVHVGRSTKVAAGMGCVAMLGVYLLTTLVIGGAASLPAVGFHGIGIVLGALSMHWLTRQQPDRIRDDLGTLVPWAALPYLLALFAVNGLLSVHWTTPDVASRAFYDLGLLPLFNYYIVSKAQAAKNIVGHAVMYAPVGVMIWLRATRGGGKGTAFVVAASLAAIVETARFLRPGLTPDINVVPLAGIAAWLAATSMPMVWQMVAAVATGGPGTVSRRLSHGAPDAPAHGWRNRGDGRTRDSNHPAGDIEHY